LQNSGRERRIRLAYECAAVAEGSRTYGEEEAGGPAEGADDDEFVSRVCFLLFLPLFLRGQPSGDRQRSE
jgi:hypothetical protein